MTQVPASSRGFTLPSQWATGGFGGLTITSNDPLGTDVPLLIQGVAGTGGNLIRVVNDVRPILSPPDPTNDAFTVTGDGSVYFRSGSGSISFNVVSQDGTRFLNYRSGVGLGVYFGSAAVHQLLNASLGFFGHAPAAQQSLTSGTATPEQIALALQANGFCGGT